MANVNVTIRMDENLKKQAEELFSDFGLSFNAAMVMFTKQSIREQRIPFEITRNTISMASNDAVSSVSKQLIDQNMVAYKELAK
nr:MAG TPA: addiction module antitoxin [Caudoviricetes sp.]